MSNVRNFGATGDGTVDDTQAIRHALEAGDGMLRFPRGTYRITETIDIDLQGSGPHAIDGTGGTARLIMAGPGPAFRLVGTHGGTGDPSSAKGNVTADQRMPTVANMVIEGEHPEADGIELVKTLQLVVQGILVRHCRHGIRLVQRNRNVLITDSHVYFNRGAGIYLDQVNLHQINITGSHISYNRLGGIRIEGSEVRNLQITGNDIEYNNHKEHKSDPVPTAEIYVDCSQPGASVNEITIASNTIQATASPGGANIRIIDSAGGQEFEPRLWAITGNIIGSQQNNVHLTRCHGMTLSGNCIYSCAERNLLVEDSHHIALSGNVFRRHTPSMGTGVRLVGCHDIAFSGCSIHDEHPEGQPTGASLLELVDCQRINVSGCQLTDGVPYGVDSVDCSGVLITGCTIQDTRNKPKSQSAIRFAGTGQGNLIAASSIGRGLDGRVSIEESASVQFDGNSR